MSHSAAPTSPMLRVDRRLPIPLHKQVYDGYRTASLQRDLRPGQEIPSSRACATELRISRFPVLHAYAQLIAAGYFEGRVGSESLSRTNFPNNSLPPTGSPGWSR